MTDYPSRQTHARGDTARGHYRESTPMPHLPGILTIQHDAQLDYYGKRLATCSSDKTVRIFNVVKGEAKGEPVILKG